MGQGRGVRHRAARRRRLCAASQLAGSLAAGCHAVAAAPFVPHCHPLPHHPPLWPCQAAVDLVLSGSALFVLTLYRFKYKRWTLLFYMASLTLGMAAAASYHSVGTCGVGTLRVTCCARPVKFYRPASGCSASRLQPAPAMGHGAQGPG